MKNNLELKIYKAIFFILLITAIIILSLIIYKYGSGYINERDIKNTVEAFSNIDFSDIDSIEESNLQYKGYPVIGMVKIPKIQIEYPIIEIGDIDPENAKAPMKISIIKYWGGNVNDYGNLSIAGHNNKSGTMFGKTKKLENGDIIELTDLSGQTIKYAVNDIFVTDPNDVSILLPKNKEIREVTLITCTNGNKERLIVKAQEI